jgi:hypothetical protein
MFRSYLACGCHQARVGGGPAVRTVDPRGAGEGFREELTQAGIADVHE